MRGVGGFGRPRVTRFSDVAGGMSEAGGGDVEVEILSHPAVAIFEFCDPIIITITKIDEAFSIGFLSVLANVMGHVLHVGELGEVGDSRGVSDGGNDDGIRILSSR